MPLISVTDATQWDAFMTSQPRSQFTQSWAWGDFRISLGQTIERLALVGDDGRWEAAALLIHFPKPVVGGYWYAPRGPVIREGEDPGLVMTRFLEELKKRGLSKPSLFWRVEPPVMAQDVVLNLKRSHAYMPATTLLIDLMQSEDELLKQMHEKTRYNIRVAERRGVTVREAHGPDAIEAFLKLNSETAERDGFRSMPNDYIKKTYDVLSKAGMARIRLAEKDHKVLAASFEMVYGDTVTYLYGASSSQARNVMAPYALHWDAIRAAKEFSHRLYDFHGLNPENASSSYFKKSWEGITRFKLGWGGERVDYVGTWEMPTMPLVYAAFRLISH